jgi:hypothetical protein
MKNIKLINNNMAWDQCEKEKFLVEIQSNI